MFISLFCMFCFFLFFFFFFKQKTAYEMRISDWSSDVCSSDLFDLKEFWHIGREIPDDSKYRDVMPSNLWPSEVEGFREKGYALYRALDDLGAQVLSALELHIDLPESDRKRTRLNSSP